ncbi:Sister chromatid cohesion protein 2 [Haplosporangium sp. Z 767]|nr:Sister chromatid cohesion protein 2 [Haplosporangium sp. Z 767]
MTEHRFTSHGSQNSQQCHQQQPVPPQYQGPVQLSRPPLQSQPIPNMTLHQQTQYPAEQHSIEAQHDNSAWNMRHLPTSAQSGLQYSALASITSTDSVLRDLPSLSIALSDFRLVQPRDPAVRAMLNQEGLSQHAANFQTEYIKSLVANANVDNICFQSASQITASKEMFSPKFDQPLSALSQSVLDRCSYPNTENFHSGNVYELPRIDTYGTLVDFRDSWRLAKQNNTIQSSPTSSASNVLNKIDLREMSLSLPSSQKRGAVDTTDDEQEEQTRKLKKAKSRMSSAGTTIKIEVPIMPGRPLSTETPAPSSQHHSENSTPPSSVTSAPATPALSITPRFIPTTQENDPTSDFEDIVAELLERTESTNNDPNDDVRHLLVSELKHLGRVIEDLSKQELLPDVQIDTLSTLLRYLDTSMNRFDAMDVFAIAGDESANVGQDQSEEITRTLEQIILSLEHISLCLIILNGKGLQQHLFPEELLITALNVFKSHVEKFLAPALEFSKDDNALSKGSTMFKAIAENSALKVRMLSIVSVTCEISEKLRRSGKNELSDDIIVKLVYIALSLFFIDTSSELVIGLTEAESLKQAGSCLMRMIYAKHPMQRTWILEEILSLLIKLPHGKKVTKGYRLIDGSKIHTSSALLLQLVDTCAESPLACTPPLDFQELHRSTQKLEMQKLLDGVKVALEGIKTSVGYIFTFLLSRCTKGTKSSVEADYRMVLDSLLTDLLTVLGQPEWPSAEVCLFIFSKAMARYLDDPKADSASRTMAVDSLGLIAAKIKTVSNQLAVNASDLRKVNLEDDIQPFYGELSIETKLSDIQYLQASYRNAIDYLGSSEANDSAAKSAKNSWICQWLFIICSAAVKDVGNQSWASDSWDLLTEEAFSCWKLYNGRQKRPTRSQSMMNRKPACQSAAYLTSRQQLFLSFDMLLSRILMALEGDAITLRAKSLKALSLIVTGDYAVLAQQNVRKTIALRLQDQSPTVRDAAIDLVGKYMLQDATIRKAYYEIVSDRISDTGLNVRKRVLRLLKDMFHKADSPVMRNDISQKLLLRVNDDETTVRELAIKSVSDVWFGQFIQATSISQDQGSSEDQISVGTVTPSQMRDVSARSRMLVDMVGQLTIQQDEAFGSVIQSLLKKERGHDQFNISAPNQEFARTCAVIVNCLVDLIQTLQDEDAPKSAVISTVHTLHTFIKAEPRLIDAKHLSSLLVYLHCSATSEDWRITMFVLRIYQDAIPVVQNMTSSDLIMAEKLALALVAKCPVILLAEAVSVLCLIVRTLTLQSVRLCKFFQTCVDLLSADARRLQAGAVVQENKTRRLMTIVGLLCQHFMFDQAIKESPKETHLLELKARMTPTVNEFVFEILVSLFDGKYSQSVQQTALQSLGSVFMSFPILMNSERSLRIMGVIFSGHDNDLKIELLQIFASFLFKIQSTPAKEQNKGPEYSLIAKAEDHLEAGIGSAIMQRFLDRILECALINDKRLQVAAVDVIAQVTLQALVHPMLPMPAIVALETSDDLLLSERVFKIHQDLHQKHASLIYARSMDCIRTMYIYQKGIQGTDVQGFKVVPETGNASALLSRMYRLVSDKRQARNALLSGLIKILDINLTPSILEVDGSYARFIGENLAYLEFKTMEEVYLVIFYLNRIIASAGMTLLECLMELDAAALLGDDILPRTSNKGQRPRGSKDRKSSKSAKKKSKLRATIPVDDGSGEDVAEGVSSGEDIAQGEGKDGQEPVLPIRMIAKASVQMEVVMVLKSHLKRMYDISETKCQQFQPTAHASHKEKPTPRFTGVLAKIEWHWKPHEVDRLCEQPGENAASIELVKKQLERFKDLIEAETIQRLRDEDESDSHQNHHHSNGSQRGHARKADAHSDEEEDQEDADNDNEEY